MVKAVVVALFIILVIQAVAISERASAAPSTSLVSVGSFQDALAPGSSKNYTVTLTDSYDNLLLYAKGGDNNPNDTFDVTFPPSTNSFTSIQGEVWLLTGPATAGTYNLTVAVNPDAAAALSFQVALYKVPEAPINFSGEFLQSGSVPASSVLFSVPTDGVYSLNMTALTGDFAVTLDGNTLGTVTGTNTTTQSLTTGTEHELDIENDPLGESPNQTQWAVQVGSSTGPLTPTLSVNILQSCATNTSNETFCTLTAQVIASDGKNVSANYQWSSNAGSFNSNSSQVVEWTAPPVNQPQTYEITCNATAQGYVAGTATVPISVTPVPEFASDIYVLLIASLAVAVPVVRTSLDHTQKPKSTIHGKRLKLTRRKF